MRDIFLFCEDIAQETVLSAVTQMFSDKHRVPIRLHVRSATGGFGKVGKELRIFIRGLKKNREVLPDLLIVGRDANCKGVHEREKEFEPILESYGGNCICAVPDPHIERWLLVDSSAFKEVFGRGCQLPDQKCDKGRYKDLFEQAIADSGQTPLLGGIEHATDLVKNMDLPWIEKSDPSFGRFLKELRTQFNSWKS